MSERNFSRRRRGGMRFRPTGGIGHGAKPDKNAMEARAEATGEKKTDALFERQRHEDEVERAENVAAGLPPEGVPAPESEAAEDQKAPQQRGGQRQRRGDFRKPHLDTPEEVNEEKYEPVRI